MTKVTKEFNLNSSEEKSFIGYILEILSHYELAFAFVRKEIIVKLSKTFLGKLWLLFQPLITIIIYSIFFGQLLKLDTGSSPYPLFLISGLTLWNYFSSCSSIGGNILISNQDIIRKTPFPKIILNVSSALYTLLEQLPLFIIVIILAILYQQPTFYQLIFAPIAYLMIILFSLGVSNLLANLSYKKRDIIYVYTYVLQVLMWTTPVFYPTTIIPERFLPILYINPLTGLLDIFRWSLNIQPLPNNWFLFSLLSTLLIFLVSIFLYKRNEKFISDYI